MTKIYSVYDFIIIGAGPAGLTLAHYLTHHSKKKILLIERAAVIGGLHRVRRVNEMFTEHGPRIYLNNYHNFMEILEEMGTNFYDLFTPYNFNISSIGSDNFTFHDIIYLIIHYILFLFFPSIYRNFSVADFSKFYRLSQKSQDYLDRLCRLTDGATSEKYPMYTFYQLINQNIFYTIYQPNMPNDLGFLKIWKNSLDSTGLVDYLFDTEVDLINFNQKKLISITAVNKNGKIYDLHAKHYLFAIPPQNLLPILLKSNLPQKINPNFIKWVENTSYLTYIPITFHWNQKLSLENVWGFPKTNWGVAFVVLSDYFKSYRSKTLISTCITIKNNYSKYLPTPKKVDDCNEAELKYEVFHQLRESFPNLMPADDVILSPEIHYVNGRWISKDKAYIYTGKDGGYIPYRILDGYELYNIGTQNGNSKYAFTSLESAVSNAKKWYFDSSF